MHETFPLEIRLMLSLLSGKTLLRELAQDVGVRPSKALSALRRARSAGHTRSPSKVSWALTAAGTIALGAFLDGVLAEANADQLDTTTKDSPLEPQDQ